MKTEFEIGTILISKPFMEDKRFEKTIILIVESNRNGTVGFIINKPLEYNFEDIFSGLGKDFIIYDGGPVNKDNLYYIHNTPNLISNSIEVSDNLFWGGDFMDVKNLIKNNKIGSNNIRFFSGYSGWTISQLKNEIREKSWIITNNRFKDKILNSKTNELWKEDIEKLGNDYKIWSNAPENPNLN